MAGFSTLQPDLLKLRRCLGCLLYNSAKIVFQKDERAVNRQMKYARVEEPMRQKNSLEAFESPVEKRLCAWGVQAKVSSAVSCDS